MNYKKIFRSREVRRAVLNMLSFVPDAPMVRLQYRIKTGRRLNLKAPQRFSEKLQWYKLYYRDPAMVQCVDKYDVRAYVEELGLGEILNGCYGVYDRAEDVDFDALPDRFVLKDTLGGGGNSVILVKDKAQMDRDAVMRQMQEWVKRPNRIRGGGREWPYYSGAKHRIIAERYIEADAASGGLIDYKFFCFGGRAAYLYVIADRDLGQSAGFGVFDSEYRRLPVVRVDEKPLTRDVPRPENFGEMRAIAERLSARFPHARVDMYSVQGRILFGEITFFDGSGYMTFDPDSFDMQLGEAFVLPEKNHG